MSPLQKIAMGLVIVVGSLVPGRPLTVVGAVRRPARPDRVKEQSERRGGRPPAT